MNHLGIIFIGGLFFILGWNYPQQDSSRYIETVQTLSIDSQVDQESIDSYFSGHRWLSSVVTADRIDINQYYQKSFFKNSIASEGKVTRQMISPRYWIEKRECASSPYMDRPVRARMTSGYGRRVHPLTGRRHIHAGVDFRGKRGTPVMASAGGYVKSVKRKGAYGKTVIISHGNSYTTLYGHLSSYAIKEGEWINQGQTLGYIGRTGRATGPHLHFEVRCHNVPVNPSHYLGKQNRIAKVKFRKRVRRIRHTASIKRRSPNLLHSQYESYEAESHAGSQKNEACSIS